MNPKPGGDEEERGTGPESGPFDDFAVEAGKGAGRRAGGGMAVLRAISGVAMTVAVVGALVVIGCEVVRAVRPAFGWKLKSAVPLIAIGVSYASLQFTLNRKRLELCLSLAVSAGFIFWGLEQYIPVPRIASALDNVVVLIFVTDLSLVIRSHLVKRP